MQRSISGSIPPNARQSSGSETASTSSSPPPPQAGRPSPLPCPSSSRLARDPGATALYLYPTKALANDQYGSLREIEQYTGISTNTAIYDGDTPQGRRAAIRERSRIVISNPYELHQILPWHSKWSRFYRGLRFIVIDEAHRYRGVFGAQVAGVLRRLLRICRHYGSEPQFVLSTATIANPVEFAGALTGVSASPISEDGSPAGRKTFVLYNPYAEGIGDRSTHQETSDLFTEALRQDCRTICFTASRRTAELVARWSQEALGEERAHTIASYRAGYLPEERREIERALKRGDLTGVVSTNALELGIDIGSLDGAILSGYPGTMMSVWQQAGRAGRRGGDAFAVMVAFADPLNQYFMRHPAAFFAKPHEHAVLDPDNPFILAGHLLCAAAELPLDIDRDRTFFGEGIAAVTAALEQQHLLTGTRRGLVYAGRGRATEAVGLDGSSSDTFRILHNGRLLETMNRAQAYREAHPGAVLLHRGETYTVVAMDIDERVVRVRETEDDCYTQPSVRTDVAITVERKRQEIGDLVLSFGEVEVSEEVAGYTVRRRGSVVESRSLDLPPIQFPTKALWFTVPEALTGAVVRAGGDLAGGLHGAEHALIAAMPYHVVCDRRDIGGISTPFHPATGEATIVVYDGCAGGIGLAEKAYHLLAPWVSMTAALVRDCPCETGCPACIYSPKCGNGNQPLDKQACRLLLDGMVRVPRSGGGRGGIARPIASKIIHAYPAGNGESDEHCSGADGEARARYSPGIPRGASPDLPAGGGDRKAGEPSRQCEERCPGTVRGRDGA